MSPGNWSLAKWTFFQHWWLAEYSRKMRVKGGGSTVLWSRYFHHKLALQKKIALNKVDLMLH